MSRHKRFAFILFGILCIISRISGVLLPPDIPQNAVVIKGETTKLQCKSNKTEKVSWAFGGTPFTSTCGDYCANVPVFGTGAGFYSCGDSDTGPGVQRPVATLVVLDSEIYCGPQKTPVIEGETVIMICNMKYTITEPAPALKPENVDKQTLGWNRAGSVPAEKPEKVAGDLQTSFSISVVAAKETIPSYNCTADFTFIPFSDVNHIHADNNISIECATGPITVWYCPKTVIITPSSGPFFPGDKLTCSSDGYPEPSLEWSGTYSIDGPVSSTGSTLTLPSTGQTFTVTCTATGNFTTPCSASKTISGTIIVCPNNTKIDPSPTAVIEQGKEFTCSSTFYPDTAKYAWYDGSGAKIGDGQKYTVNTSGYQRLKCVVSLTVDSYTCNDSATIDYTVFDCPETVIITPSSGPFSLGCNLTCSSDGYPAPSLAWSGTFSSDGPVSSTGPTLTLPYTEQTFTVTCTATGNFTTPCNASKTITGTINATTVNTATAPVTTSAASISGTTIPYTGTEPSQGPTTTGPTVGPRTGTDGTGTATPGVDATQTTGNETSVTPPYYNPLIPILSTSLAVGLLALGTLFCYGTYAYLLPAAARRRQKEAKAPLIGEYGVYGPATPAQFNNARF